MKKHRKWTALLDYFERPEAWCNKIKRLLEEEKNVLILIKKKEGEKKNRRKDVFNKFCEMFPAETLEINKKIILSMVPDIEKVEEGVY